MKTTRHAGGKKHLTDADYIRGLKSGDQEITYRFFYELCAYTLHDIWKTLLERRLDFDDVVNELYVYLSDRNWHKLDTFAGLNGCRLSSWMIPLSWRFFLQRRRALLGMAMDDSKEIGKMKDDRMDDFDVEVALEVEQTFLAMPNPTYVNVLRWLLIEGFSYEEVAGRLGTTVSNVYNLKHRAILQFMDNFGDGRKKIRRR